MTTEEKFDLIIKKLNSLEEWQSRLELKLETEVSKLREDLFEFKNETEQNFENTNKLINQAFEKISENIPYQEKIKQIDRIIHSKQSTYA